MSKIIFTDDGNDVVAHNLAFEDTTNAVTIRARDNDSNIYSCIYLSRLTKTFYIKVPESFDHDVFKRGGRLCYKNDALLFR